MRKTQDEIYEVIALAMRYWFVFLGVLIVWRSFSWLRKDRRARHKKLKKLPDAGMIGELAVLHGSDELPEGTIIPMPYEGTLGFVRSCDIAVPVDQVAGCHLDFSFQPHLGLLLYLRRGQRCLVDGTELTCRSKPRSLPMLHGSTLQVGDAVLQLRLFAELDAMSPRTAVKQKHAETPPQPTLFGQKVKQYPSWKEAPSGKQTLFGRPLEKDPGTKPDRQRRSSNEKNRPKNKQT